MKKLLLTALLISTAHIGFSERVTCTPSLRDWIIWRVDYFPMGDFGLANCVYRYSAWDGNKDEYKTITEFDDVQPYMNRYKRFDTKWFNPKWRLPTQQEAAAQPGLEATCPIPDVLGDRDSTNRSYQCAMTKF